jgi:5-methylcytosine-specific restriction endonuclease McrA
MTSKKVLLLNSTYEVLSFISERKALKLFVKGKVDVVSDWPDVEIHYGTGKINFPATLRLKYFVKKNYAQLTFSRKAVFKRDRFSCQYCSRFLKSGQVTVDHVIPKSMGGPSSFTNCVTSCYGCNNKKGNRTPDQANMLLLVRPAAPIGYLHYISEQDAWHDDWSNYFGGERKIQPR